MQNYLTFFIGKRYGMLTGDADALENSLHFRNGGGRIELNSYISLERVMELHYDVFLSHSSLDDKLASNVKYVLASMYSNGTASLFLQLLVASPRGSGSPRLRKLFNIQTKSGYF